MKNRILSGLLVLLSLCHCRCTNQNEENGDVSLDENDPFGYSNSCLPDVADSYNYSIVPGTEAWNNLGSFDEALRVCQLPSDVLKKMSTPGLIRSFLDIPMLSGHYHAWSQASPTTTMNRIYPYYNSAVELLSRKDVGSALLSYYDAVCLDCIETMMADDSMTLKTVGELLYFNVQIIAIESFFIQKKILDQLNSEDIQKVVSVLLSTYEQILALINDDDFRWRFATGEVLAYIMYYANYDPVVKYFNSGEELLPILEDTVDEIISFAKQFIN